MNLKEYVRAHPKEAMIWLMVIVLSAFILFSLQMKLWMKLMVVGILVFGALEAIFQIRGMKSITQSFRESMSDAQKGQAKAFEGMQFKGVGEVQGFSDFMPQKPKNRPRRKK